MTARSQAVTALHYALAPICIALATLLHLSAVGVFLHPTGLFVLGVVAAAWFGGVGPGFFAALLATLTLPQLIEMNYPLTAGWLDLPRFVTFAITGLAVGWGATRGRRAAALQHSEERYAIAMNAGEEGFWDWIVATDEFYASPRLLEMYGFPPGTTFAGRNDFLARFPIHPEDRLTWQESVAAHFAGKTPRFDKELRTLRDGKTRWLHLTGLATRDASGKVVRWTGSTTDITERKRAEEALQLSEERYALAMEAAQDAHWDWIVGTDQYYTSPRVVDVFGLPPGTTFTSRQDYLARTPLVKEDLQAWLHAAKELFAGTGSRLSMELRAIVHGEIRWIQHNGVCLRDASGRAVRWCGSVRDVTERKRTEEALRVSEERFALAVLGAKDGIWDRNLTTGMHYLSPRAQEISMGRPSDGVDVRHESEWAQWFHIHPDDAARREAATRDHLKGLTPRYEGEWRVRHQDGSYHWIHARGICTRDASGRAVRLAGSTTDIDARKRTEEALRASEERYAHAMEGSDAGHWDWNLVTDEMFVSKRAREMLALPDGPLPAHRDEIMALVPQHPDDRALMSEKIQAGIEAGSHEREYRVIPRPGEVRWLRSRGKVFRDAQGVPVRLTGSLLDITERKLAADALRLSEERYALALEGSNEGIWEWNLVTDELFESPHARQLYGIPDGVEIRTRGDLNAHARFHPEDAQSIQDAIQACLARRSEGFEVEYRILNPAGETRWLHCNGKVFLDADDKPARIIGSVSDITERKRAADELRESEARFRSLTELSSDWYWKQDENFRFTYMSNQAQALGGFSADDSFGKTRWELPGVVPLSSSWAEHQAVLAAHKSFRDFEMSRALPDGSVGYFAISGAPIFDEHGRFQGYQGTGRSITERKRIEEELRRRQEMLEVAQKAARAVPWEWRNGADPASMRWSPDLEAMFGLPPGGYDGTFAAWRKMLHPDDWGRVKSAIQHALATGEIDVEYRVVHPNGAVRWLNQKGRAFLGADGKPVRSIGFMQDVTERKRAEEELRKMEQELRRAQRLEAMGTLAGGIAHDFNNILGAILGYGEMAQRGAKKGTRLQRDLDSIMSAGERGRALVDRILAFSRSGVGERVAVHVEEVVREVLDLLAGDLPDGVRIRADLRAGRAAMLGDPTQVHQVVMNLANNAVQAMPKGGVLRVALECVRFESSRAASVGTVSPGAYIVLKIADAGTGIRPEVLERMFDPFFTTKEVGVGSGLGLSLVHGIVANVSGAIDVATEPGKGSTFTVYLPRSGDAPAKAADENRPLPRGEGQRVLVVDDEEPLVRLATETLEGLGYVPTGFTSSANALKAFDANPGRFDAILTDERMPGVTGSTIIREVRRINPSIPILLMSGYVGAAAALKARELGASDVLKKPLLARELANSLARVLHP